jgi:hypothetical protein
MDLGLWKTQVSERKEVAIELDIVGTTLLDVAI